MYQPWNSPPQADDSGKTAAGYVSMFTEDARKDAKHHVQRTYIQRYAHRHSYELTDMFEDTDLTHAFRRQPALRELLNALDRFDAVIVYGRFRLAPDARQQEQIEVKIQQAGCDLIDAKQWLLDDLNAGPGSLLPV